MQEKYFIKGGGSVAVKLLLSVLSSTALLLSGCDQAEESAKEKSETGVETVKTVVVEKSIKPKDELSQKIEALTGAPSRLVWSRYLGKSADVFANGKQHQLWGVNTQDGLGARAILKDKGNYSRPLNSPDGKWIIYTDKHTERKGGKKSYSPVMHRVDWKGEQAEDLGKGYAVDVWQDPETKVVWVYTVNLLPTERSSMFSSKLERFPIDDPKKRELVWDKTKLSIDNIQLSLDGKRASALFPWPDVGVIDLVKKEHWRNQHGCWPSMAPDNSHLAWVFDGSHKSVHVFADRGKKYSVVPVNQGPGMDGKEMYHPRWSNDVRFMVLTGPYKGATIGKSGKHAEIYIGKFDEQMKSVEAWLRVTDDNKADHFPDLWVKGGAASQLDKLVVADKGGGQAETAAGDRWPADSKGLIYVWENAAAQNQIKVAKLERTCKIKAHQRARFGRHFEMLTGGGSFAVDEASAKVLAAELDKGELAFQLRLTASVNAQSGRILALGDLQILEEKGGELVFLSKGEKFSLGKIQAGVPTHLAASLQAGQWVWYRDGKRLQGQAVGNTQQVKEAGSTLLLGDGAWRGSVEGLAVYSRSLEAGEVAKDAAFWQTQAKSRKPASRVKLKAKLVEMTELRSVEELDTYRRALLFYTYEVEEVIEGKYEQKRVLVYHWSIMDRKALSSMPRELGKSYVLEIEPLAEHPELISERRWSDSFEVLDEYFDVATPEA
ncbi:MAG: LamG domain-containing protein [Verrucomicrobiales bacterium]|nr:LamG domain-containing protein [Verrucomicrobiales bacterium]